ncbi:hypothetical protein EVAR_17125_1 [Eumeta japonica]|uniref:Uncharacterized protein n=1 Tax=Eumeta variegata TaxID=151549 RepID=A0A4C1ULS7_EUMVA|nr:hypothetical protein EVAR_17125_1 [Eumeta japonica]
MRNKLKPDGAHAPRAAQRDAWARRRAARDDIKIAEATIALVTVSLAFNEKEVNGDAYANWVLKAFHRDSPRGQYMSLPHDNVGGDELRPTDVASGAVQASPGRGVLKSTPEQRRHLGEIRANLNITNRERIYVSHKAGARRARADAGVPLILIVALSGANKT